MKSNVKPGNLKNRVSSRRFFGSLISNIVLWLFILGLFYLFLFPFYYLISTAFQSEQSVNDPSVLWLPHSLTLKNLKDTMNVLNYKDSVVLTFVITVFSTIMSIISCSLVGYGFARFRFKGKNIAFALVLLTIILPTQAILIPNYLNFRFFDFGGILKLLSPITGFSSVNLLETPWTFILPAAFGCGLRGGIFIFIFRQTFSAQPRELEEAAKIDGCGSFKTYYKIMLPLARSAIVTVCLFSFVWHWNDLYSSAMYFVGETRPIMPILNELRTTLVQEGLTVSVNMSQFSLRTYFASGALLAVLPPLILYIFLQRFFVQSIEKTGIVG